MRARAALAACVALACSVQAARAQRAGSVRTEAVSRHVDVLAHDSMRGRATPSPELEAAARYAATVFSSAGLEPAGDSGSFFQRYPIGRDTTRARPTAPNVAAVLRGRDPALRSSYVALVAHMDHVGVGRPEGADSIYNGADDNASGSAGVLAIAQSLAARPESPRRSVLFILVSGEERGLWGSRHFVEHPTVPLDSVVALVNLDMIGRNRPDSVYLNGWGKSTLSDRVRALAAGHPELRLSVGPDPDDGPQTPADSDHYPFQRRGVPYVFFLAGTHPDYHRPGDESSALDADKVARVAQLALLTVLDAAESLVRPKWDPVARRINVVRSRK